jgi:methylenetetrahydrofolate--tRNA-(uracil-5-)-methyltransferase
MERVYFAARWDKGTADYINCPMDRAEYDRFWMRCWRPRRRSQRSGRSWITSRAACRSRCWPARPRHAALRADEAGGPARSAHRQNALGRGAVAQGESARRQLQPGRLSEPPEVWRAGAGAAADSGPRERALPALRADSSQHVHLRAAAAGRNAAPEERAAAACLRRQLSGVEGYTESIATGLLAGIYAAASRAAKSPPAPRASALGSLVHYITHADAKDFQPANITFDLLEPLEEELRKKIRDKKERHRLVCERALAAFDAWWSAMPHSGCGTSHIRICVALCTLCLPRKGPPMRAISAADSVSPAIQRTREFLFRPFNGEPI